MLKPLRNALDFRLRQFLSHPLLAKQHDRLPTLADLKRGLPDLPRPWRTDLALAEVYDGVSQRYPAMAHWSRHPSQVQAESVNLLDLLDRWIPADLAPTADPRPRNYLDIGSKNWPYLPGQHAFLDTFYTRLTPDTPWQLTGVELDGFRRYRDGWRRCDYARALAQDYPHATYTTGNVLELPGPWDGVMWLMPFVWREPHLAWGLPAGLFAPQQLLAHVLQQLAPGGWLLTVHLTADEAQEQARLLRCLDPTGQLMDTVAHGPVSDRFRQFGHERVGWLWRKRPTL